eukprot:gene7111-7915_t
MLSSQDQVRLVVLGMSRVGKSALTVRFLTKRYITEYANGIDSVYVQNIPMRDKSLDVKIIDNGGKRDLSDLIKWGDGFMLVYSIVSRESFEEVKELKNTIDEIKGIFSRTACVLVGNKSDLRRQRQVTTIEAKGLARDLDCGLFEVSAAEDIEPVAEVFRHAITRTFDRKECNLLEQSRTRRAGNSNNNNNNSNSEGGRKKFGKRLSMRSKSRDRTKTL